MTRSTPTLGVHSQGPGYYWLLTSIKLRFKWQEVTGCVGMTRSTPTSGVHSQGAGYYWLLIGYLPV